MAEMSKLQIRAKVLSVLSEIKTDRNFNSDVLLSYVSYLSDIDDRKAMFDVIIKELLKMSDDEVAFCSCLIKELVPKDYVEEAVFEVLKSNSYSDEAKYKLVQMLRIVGFSSAFNEIPQYFENPQGMLDLETEKMLERASFNPETMLDFLDFIYAVSDNDKSILLASLKDDYTGDNLANLIYPILYSEFSDKIKKQVVEILVDTKSSLALAPMEYLLKVTENNELSSAIELGLKKLKFSGATQEKVNQFYNDIVCDYKPFECYATVVDGAGNQALLISRLNKDNNVNFVAVVINDVSGIVDCFGFYNISQSETKRVISKFYQSEGKYKVSECYIKTKLNNAVETTIKNKSVFPYEYICWGTLLFDLQPLSFSIDEFVSNLDFTFKFKNDDIADVLSKEYSYRWFINYTENACLKQLVEEIYNLDEIKIESVNSILVNYIDKVFDENVCILWKNRIKDLIYLLKENVKNNDYFIFVEMIKDENLFYLFKQIILQRSIFNNILLLKENVKTSVLPTNIFKKKSVNEEKYSIQKIDKIVCVLKKSWLNG